MNDLGTIVNKFGSYFKRLFINNLYTFCLKIIFVCAQKIWFNQLMTSVLPFYKRTCVKKIFSFSIKTQRLYFFITISKENSF
jgi:hypothetical protein